MTHHETCGRCGGSGQIQCPLCHGTGRMVQPGSYGAEAPCPECGGTGKDRCHACGGSGTVRLDD